MEYNHIHIIELFRTNSGDCLSDSHNIYIRLTQARVIVCNIFGTLPLGRNTRCLKEASHPSHAVFGYVRHSFLTKYVHCKSVWYIPKQSYICMNISIVYSVCQWTQNVPYQYDVLERYPPPLPNSIWYQWFHFDSHWFHGLLNVEYALYMNVDINQLFYYN